MKYQKLENQESKLEMDLSHSQTSRRGKNYPLWRKSLEESKVQELIAYQNYPEKIEEWIKKSPLSWFTH